MNTNLENILRISYTSQNKPNSTKQNQTHTNPSLVQAMPDKILEKFEDKGKNLNHSANIFFLQKYGISGSIWSEHASKVFAINYDFLNPMSRP